VVETEPDKVSYIVGEPLIPAGLVITATYSSGDTVDIPYTGMESLKKTENDWF